MGRGSRKSHHATLGSDEIRSLLLGETLDDDLTPSWIVESEHSDNSGPMATVGDDEIVELLNWDGEGKHLRFRPVLLDTGDIKSDFKCIVAGAELRRKDSLRERYYRAYLGVERIDHIWRFIVYCQYRPIGRGLRWVNVNTQQYSIISHKKYPTPNESITAFNQVMDTRLKEGYLPANGPVVIDRAYFDEELRKLRVD
jgi:hypothetical protein